MQKDEIVRQINRFFGDTSRSPEATLADLEEIRDELEIKIDALKEDIGGSD